MNAKSKLGPIAIASIMLLLAAQVAFAQVDWTWGTLEVPPGDPGSWDPGRHLMGDVVFDGTTWHMYLVGGPGDEPVAYRWKVGHWTWNDLTLEWEEDPANPVLEPDSGHWDAYSIGSVAVLHQGGMFHMWYGAAGVHLDPTYVGYATSSDGSLWIKDLGNPVAGLGPGSAGAWDDHGTAPHTVLVEGSSLRMWFFAFQGGLRSRHHLAHRPCQIHRWRTQLDQGNELGPRRERALGGRPCLLPDGGSLQRPLRHLVQRRRSEPGQDRLCRVA